MLIELEANNCVFFYSSLAGFGLEIQLFVVHSDRILFDCAHIFIPNFGRALNYGCVS